MGNDDADDLLERDPNKTSPGPAPALVSGGDLPAGYVVGEYRIEHVLGRGGMGVVYGGTQPLIEKRVAIKVLNSDLSADPALVKRFLDEARAVNRIRHPNIIDIFSFGRLADGRQYFVMEYLEGHTLEERLQAGDLPLTEYPPLLGQICDALDAAHGENIVHRDLKPENIWIVAPRRGRPFVKLLDFGIAKLLSSGEVSTTQTGMMMGTPQYMSPEQCHGRGVDPRTDIYAIGVLLYQIYTRQLPFRGETFAEVITKQLTQLPERPSVYASLPAALDDLIVRCLAKDPSDRPQSARELGESLGDIFATRAPIEQAAGLAATVAGRAPTTLRGSAHGIERSAPAARSGHRWPLAVAVVLTGAVAALAAVRIGQSGGRPSGDPQSGGHASPTALTPGVFVVKDASADASPIAHEPVPAPRDDGVRSPASSESEPPKPVRAKGSHSAASASPRRASSHAPGNGLVTDNPFR